MQSQPDRSRAPGLAISDSEPGGSLAVHEISGSEVAPVIAEEDWGRGRERTKQERERKKSCWGQNQITAARPILVFLSILLR